MRKRPYLGVVTNFLEQINHKTRFSIHFVAIIVDESIRNVPAWYDCGMI